MLNPSSFTSSIRFPELSGSDHGQQNPATMRALYPSLTLARIASAMSYTKSKIRKSNYPSGSQMRFWAHQKYMQKSIKGNTASHSGVNTLAKREQHNKKLTSPTQALQKHSSKPPRQTESR